ncbi:DNA photolyase [Leptospira sp. 96542]|nr:DNA photolyase [Leptospira sp. 96542]
MFKSFSHIYVEEAVINLERTQKIISKLKPKEVIIINHYKDSFNRSNQNFRIQKESPKLILAKKYDQFLYKGSNFSPNFEFEHFYYNTMALNCIYDCEYCYLQGMFHSANLVLFVNWEDFFDATDQFLTKNQSLYLAISYDTDLLALESFFGLTSAWIEYAEKNRNLNLEIRTKSASFRSISKYKPSENIILAWTLSPDSVIKSIEHKTPSLPARLQSMKEATNLGWKVRICIDPVILVKNWKQEYTSLANSIKDNLTPNKISEISFGGFRMNSDFLKEMVAKRDDSAILYHHFVKKDKIISYSSEETMEIYDHIRSLFVDWISHPQIKVSF